MSEDSRNEQATGLPASYEVVWGIRDRPTKGPKPGLSVERIVDAGVRVASADGIEAVSMSRVAAELGASAMSLYRYVASKDELLVLMMDAAIGPTSDVAGDDGWRAGLERWSRAELEGYRRHSWALRMQIKGPPVTPNNIGWMEQGLRCLRDTGLEPYEKMSVILMITNYTRGWASVSADIHAALAAGDATTVEIMTNYGRILTTVADPAQFPEIHEVVAAGTFDDELGGEDELGFDYEFGLARLLDGLEMLISERSDSV